MFSLFSEKKDCCACGACDNICPQNAIEMIADEYGFLYPRIDEKKCVECGRCFSVCNFQTTSVTSQPKYCYAAINRDDSVLMRSASGGVFGALAKEVLDENGVVFGCVLDEEFHPYYTFADNGESLEPMRGTKYVHAATEKIFRTAKQYLDKGSTVLYSGLPCQIDGLYGYLGKNYDNLLTVDLICHGVSSEKLFKKYIDFLQEKTGGRITRIFIRDKKRGWGSSIRFIYEKDGVSREKIIPSRNSSYVGGFLSGEICRENCYLCKYASAYRVGDFTIGDYWGVSQEHPELFENRRHDYKKGVSVLLVNSEKAKAVLDKCKYLDIFPTQLKKIAEHNANLVRPTFCDSASRQRTLNTVEQLGYRAYDENFMKTLGIKKYVNLLVNKCPRILKDLIKK